MQTCEIEYGNKHSRDFSLLSRMFIEKGTLEDWEQLHDFHYKTETSTFGPTYYRVVLDEQLIGVCVMSYPKLLLEPRHRMFPKLKPKSDSKITNTWRAKYVNDTFAINSRSVVDTLFRGVGVSYRMLNLASRMHPRRVLEIQSAMSKYNPFAMKAGFKFAKQKMPPSYNKAMAMFSRHFESHPFDIEGLMDELAAMSPAVYEKAIWELREFYYNNSALEKTGRNLGRKVENMAEYSDRELIKNIQGLCFASPLYGCYINPDYGRELPDRIPLTAFDNQAPNEPLKDFTIH